MILLTFGILYSTPALISVLINIREGGFAQSERNIPMFWSNEEMNATGMAAYFMFNMCIPAIILVSRKKMNILAILLFSIIFILSILCILRLGSRTQLGVIALTFLFSFFTLALPTQSFKQNLVSIISILIIGSVVSRYVSFDWDAEWTTSFAGRMKESGGDDLMSGGGRLELWQKSLEHLFEKPLGWDVEEFGHSHNLWLDVLRSGGVLSFITLILISSRYILLLKRTLLNVYINRDLKGVLGNFSIALFAYFMVEPVFDGPFTFFTFFCFLFGFAFTLNESLVVQSNSDTGKLVSDQ
jgi:O-antigen ligase